MEKMDIFDYVTLEKPTVGFNLIVVYPTPFNRCVVREVKESQEYENLYYVQFTTTTNPNTWKKVLWIRRKCDL